MISLSAFATGIVIGWSLVLVCLQTPVRSWRFFAAALVYLGSVAVLPFGAQLQVPPRWLCFAGLFTGFSAHHVFRWHLRQQPASIP